uniref:Cleavage and polyadenylation specificity factor subunit 1 n=1 Tax=Meloidogyne javanica TaxID=6303 RepID=A0A915N8V0_MELJA
MYSILHETDDATSVNFCFWGKFLPYADLLVTAGAKTLQCLLSFTMMAPIRGMAVIRLEDFPDFDALALTFDDAKLSIVNINPSTMTLNTLSLHSIEDELLREGYAKDIHHPVLCADPESRCCVFTVYGRHLAVVPIKRINRVNKENDCLPNKDGRQILLQSYTIKLRSLDERLENIHDMCFLHGYFEPTILFLYEPIQTTAGRAAVRFDTVSILAVFLNLKDKIHTVVWNFSGLPMNINRCLPINPPIGGICLFGANEIVYLNQSVPPRGISLNSCSEEFIRFPLSTQQQNLKLVLEGCAVERVSNSPNDVFVVLSNGELYILSLETDQANVVRNMHLTKTFETSIPCVLTSFSTNFLFVGSRLGDSQLLRYSLDKIRGSNDYSNNQDLVNHSRILFNDDDIFLYGDDFCKSFLIEETLRQVVRTYKFELLDVLPNIGPCKWLRVCNATYISDAFRKNARDVYFDMMTASGHGKDSSLCLYHRSVRPQIITSTLFGFNGIEHCLDEAQQIWTIGRHYDDMHKYLLISRERSTVALELHNDMIELDTPLFCTNESTLMAGDLAEGNVAVQITPTSIVLVANDQQIDCISIDSSFPVISASLIDPYLALLTLNGRFFLYQLFTKPNIHLKQIPILNVLKHEKSPITAISLYKDCSGLIQYSDNKKIIEQEESSSANEKLLFPKSNSLDSSLIKNEMDEDLATKEQLNEEDDIDAFLYGVTEKERNKTQHQNEPQKQKVEAQKQQQKISWLTISNELSINANTDEFVERPSKIIPTFWLFFTRENGNLYIYNLPNLQLVRKFCQAHDVLYDDVQSAIDDEHRPSQQSFMNTPIIVPQPAESLSSDTIVKPEEKIFELQICGLGMSSGRPVLSALFKRLPCTVVIREKRFLGPNGRAQVEAHEVEDRHRQRIFPFGPLSNLSNGIFIAGAYPSILLINRSGVQLHPMTIDGQITAFSSFNNANCKNGFLYLTKKPEHMMRVATLNSDIDYDCSYPHRKIPIGQTISHVVFMLQADLIMLVTSEKKPNKTVCTIVNEEKQVETHDRDENFILPSIDSYKLRLFSTEDWKFVPNFEFQLEEFEVATACEEVLLTSESTVSGVKNYLALGTAINYGEEVYVRGRVVLFELIEVVPEEGMPTTRHKLKTIYDKEQKGPVTSLCAINGFLLTGMGQKEEFKALSLVSRDLRPTAPTPMTAQFIIDHKQLGFILTDELANITLFNYLPEMKESIGGERLIIRAILNIGSLINTIVRVKGHVSECFIDSEQQRGIQTCYFATLDGSFGFIKPIIEKVFRRLHMLQQMMNMYVPQPAGLNPRGSRAGRPQKTGTNQQISAAKNIIDGLLTYINSNFKVQYYSYDTVNHIDFL